MVIDPPAKGRMQRIDPRVGYAICTVMRSGSTWLAELLGSTGVLGKPSEYFSTSVQQRLDGADYPTDRKAQAARILTVGATPNGVYGFKIFPVYFNQVAQAVDWATAFPDLRFIHLRRRDLVGQAISRVRAQQTRQWRSNMSALDASLYDGDMILEAMRTTAFQDARWEIYFARNGIEPLRLVYEDMIAAAQPTVDAVANLVGVTPPAVEPERVEIEVQRDAQSAEWRERFMSAYADRNWLDEGWD